MHHAPLKFWGPLAGDKSGSLHPFSNCSLASSLPRGAFVESYSPPPPLLANSAAAACAQD